VKAISNGESLIPIKVKAQAEREHLEAVKPLDKKVESLSVNEYLAKLNAIAAMDNMPLFKLASQELEWRIQALESWIKDANRAIKDVAQRLDQYKETLNGFDEFIAQHPELSIIPEVLRIYKSRERFKKKQSTGGGVV
jgi:prefoldin subunit 5